MSRFYAFLSTMAVAIVMVVLTYLILRPSGLQRTVELLHNFLVR
jgi:hypothetical protein